MTETDKNISEKSELRENSKAPQPKKRGWPFWVVFFVSGWMFFLGILVGRGTSPVNFDIDDLEKKIARLKKTALKSEEMAVQEANPLSPEIKPELEFFEVLKMAEQNDSLDLKLPKTDVKINSDIPAKMENSQKTQPPVIPNIVAKSSKTPEIKRNEVITSPPAYETVTEPEKTDKQFSIQVASLRDQAEADRLVERFRNKGYRAYRTSAEIRNSGTWHRVRIGPFKKQSEALQILVPVSREIKGALIIEHAP